MRPRESPAARPRCSRSAAFCVGLLIASAGASGSAARSGELPQEVFLWYVNETAPVDADRTNYETIIHWLESGDSDRARNIAQTLRDELSLFPAAVDREQHEIETQAAAAAGHMEAMLVTNRLAQRGEYRYYDRQRGEFAIGSLPVMPSEDYVLTSHPLVRREMLDAVLAEAARRYDPSRYRFVLVTKSHGGENLALAVRLARHHEDISREQLLASLAGTEAAPPAPDVGVKKGEYLSLLAEAGRLHGMRFSLVFMEACRGTFELGAEQQLPENVDILYTSGNRFLEYSTLDYPLLLGSIRKGPALSTVLDQHLAPRYMALYRPETARWSPWYWFVPLAGWLLWRVIRLGAATPPDQTRKA